MSTTKRIGFALTATLLLAPIAVSPAASAQPSKPAVGQGPNVGFKGNKATSTEVQRLAAVAPITQDAILSRADSWLGQGIIYNGGGRYNGYRTDCSGFVSMAWGLGAPGMDTTSYVPSGTARWISKGDLQPGDVLLDDDAGDNGHVVIFDHWDSPNQSSYVGTELSGNRNVVKRHIPYPYDSTPGDYAPARFNGSIPARGGTHLFAQSPNKDGVFMYSGFNSVWTKVGGPAGDIITGGAGLFATNPANGDLFRYNGTPNSWSKVGGPARRFAVAGDQLFGLSSDGSGVYKWQGGTSWIRVGGRSADLIGGDGGLFATNPDTGNIYRYNGTPDSWTQVGGPGGQFVVGGGKLYATSPDHNAVFQWNGSGTSWTRIGGSAGNLYAGWAGLFATNPSTGEIFKYNGTPNSWTKIGNRGEQFAVADGEIYGLSPNRDAVMRWTRSGTTWTQVGGPAFSIAVGN
ncbi:hypothetical protein GCM10027589_34140 [Actinocorallia lasiicapitis]